MTLTFPRTFPVAPSGLVTRCTFDVTPIGGFSRAASGQIAFQQTVGGALWELSLTTMGLNSADYDLWHSFILSLKTGGTFKGFDPRLNRNYPLAYGTAAVGMARAGGGTFDGTASITAAGGEVISLGSPLFLPANFIVTVGDYISFAWLGGQYIVKAMETKVADGSGVLANLSVSPWLRSGGTVPVTASLVDPYCLMKIKPGSWQGDRQGGYFGGPVAFDAIQTLA